ncbi:DUF305 domain-containing protein [Ilumatobacter sp.]|uniref:DUF305 domain-containing protein n=1 Tax=Ilumatobacter sp. TaxID=1967498 RepID=UPI003C3C7F0E
MAISRRRLLTAGAAGSAGAVIGFTAHASAAPSTASGVTPSDADIGFCTDMAAHHVQALALCQRVLGRDTGDPVQAAASEVLQNQAIEVGMMRAWLTDWGEATNTSELVMGWMGANDGAGVPISMMEGYASAAALQELSTTDGLAAGRLWLELMRAHHVGGVSMAEHAAAIVSTDKVRRLATTQAEVQTFEISQYDALIGGTYAIDGWVRPASLDTDTWVCDIDD